GRAVAAEPQRRGHAPQGPARRPRSLARRRRDLHPDGLRSGNRPTDVPVISGQGDAMRNLIATGRLIALAALLSAAGLCHAAIAEEAKVTAFSVWQGKGQTYATGLKQGTLVGTVSGPMYIITEQGPVSAGDMVCPLVVTFDESDGSQTGQVRCIISGKDGTVFGQLTCTGFQFVGCSGDFKITGGTGRFSGITGGGKALVHAE